VVCLDAIYRAAVRAATSVLADQLLPLLECEVLAGRGRTALITSNSDVAASPLEIPLPPLLVVVKAGAWVFCVTASSVLAFSRAKLITMLLSVEAVVFPTSFTVALMPGTIAFAYMSRERWILRVPLALCGKDRSSVGCVSIAI
jgi:hypothetical protein